ncbi:MAG: hypothetical protein J3K34DRAFT_505604 [Monoraphidium minutum]|nr:MAG: hypothetical protein J3K34DRAFT_505604 [Monoraphidium minutum]
MSPVARVALLFALLALGGSSLVAAEPEEYSGVKDARGAVAFCKSPAFKAASCRYNGRVSAEEEAATLNNQCFLCGTAYAGLPPPESLPAVIEGVDRYSQSHIDAVSLACAGPAVVRSVFKILEIKCYDTEDRDSRNCSGIRLDAPSSPPAGPLVRCELKVAPGPGSEASRALVTKEGRCFVCGLCSQGAGCPANIGQWYTETYVTSFSGCAGVDTKKGYYANRIGFHVNPGYKFLLAKFEVCNGPSCFNPAYEAAKLKGAKRCVKGTAALGRAHAMAAQAGAAPPRELRFWVADAFAPAAFQGNPAAVYCLDEEMGDGLRQRIAAEHNLSETAYVTLPPGTPAGSGLAAFKAGDSFGLRWFTPAAEVPLCGHATLAAAHVLFAEVGNASAALHFDTRSGRLTVRRAPPAAPGAPHRLELALPWAPAAAALPPSLSARGGGGGGGGLAALVAACAGGLGAAAVAFEPGMKYFIIELPGASGTTRGELEGIRPDFSAMAAAVGAVEASGAIVTARGGGGDGYDFYSRFFGPWLGVDEDPVTGSAHCVLGPWWGAKLGKAELSARQCSARGGDVRVRLDEAARRVFISGEGVTTMRGTLLLPPQ